MQLAVRPARRVADHHVQAGQAGHVGAQLRQGAFLRVDEGRAQQQIFGRVAGERELGGDQHVGAAGMGFASRLQDLGGIAGQASDDGIDLREGDTGGAHGNTVPSVRKGTGQIIACGLTRPGKGPRRAGSGLRL